MAPKPWASDEQLAFLQSKLPRFIEMQAEQKLHLFWPGVQEAWFRQFPEEPMLGLPTPGTEDTVPLTDEQLLAVGEAISTRKGQLDNWFRYQRAKMIKIGSAVHQNSLSGSSLASALFTSKPKRQRRHQPLEVYQKQHGDKIREALTKAGYDQLNEGSMSSGIVDENDVEQIGRIKTARALRMQMRTQIIKEMWDGESEEERARCTKVAEDEPQTSTSSQRTPGEEDRTPKEFQIAIDQLDDVLVKVHGAIESMAGWKGFTVMGGPNPGMNGSLTVKITCFGVSSAGNNFRDSHPSWEESVSRPFGEWLKRSFSSSVRRARAAITDESTEDSEETTATDAPAAKAKKPRRPKRIPKRQAAGKTPTHAPAAAAADSCETLPPPIDPARFAAAADTPEEPSFAISPPTDPAQSAAATLFVASNSDLDLDATIAGPAPLDGTCNGDAPVILAGGDMGDMDGGGIMEGGGDMDGGGDMEGGGDMDGNGTWGPSWATAYDPSVMLDGPMVELQSETSSSAMPSRPAPRPAFKGAVPETSRSIDSLSSRGPHSDLDVFSAGSSTHSQSRYPPSALFQAFNSGIRDSPTPASAPSLLSLRPTTETTYNFPSSYAVSTTAPMTVAAPIGLAAGIRARMALQASRIAGMTAPTMTVTTATSAAPTAPTTVTTATSAAPTAPTTITTVITAPTATTAPTTFPLPTMPATAPAGTASTATAPIAITTPAPTAPETTPALPPQSRPMARWPLFSGSPTRVVRQAGGKQTVAKGRAKAKKTEGENLPAAGSGSGTAVDSVGDAEAADKVGAIPLVYTISNNNHQINKEADARIAKRKAAERKRKDLLHNPDGPTPLVVLTRTRTAPSRADGTAATLPKRHTRKELEILRLEKAMIVRGEAAQAERDAAAAKPGTKRKAPSAAMGAKDKKCNATRSIPMVRFCSTRSGRGVFLGSFNVGVAQPA
ncbi:hypothetical protein C8J57DRAFT_1711843 [Mycena rebaudengoi]|nr:hypothetical protein C8J57DRAFT_1711843 [Mycena rebaudengoi]